MAYTVTINLTDLEERLMRSFCIDIQDFVENFVRYRIDTAKEEIYQREVQRMLNDPSITTMPANKDEIVNQAQWDLATPIWEAPPMNPQGGAT